MSRSAEQFAHRLLSGQERGVAAALLRGALAAAEPLYSGAMRARNALYSRGVLRAHRLACPVISVGNITAGGTGKTPLVRWLAERLLATGRRPAVLMRGYRQRGAQISDEQRMLQQYLGEAVVVHADPDRVRGGQTVLAEHPEVDVLLLDDGFQHRRLGRDVDLVLIDATNPFGFGHVHPRGLLREPLCGLGRASAVVLTRCDLVAPAAIAEIEGTIRRHNASSPIFHASHVHTGVRTAEGEERPLSALAGRRYFAAAAIANPQALAEQLRSLPGTCAGTRWLADHHDYSEGDVLELKESARSAGADVVLVTEKDWAKISRLGVSPAGAAALWRLQLAVHLAAGEEAQLLRAIAAGPRE